MTDLPGDAFHHHPGHRSDGAAFRVIERALWMIQAGQGTDLLLGHSGLVGRLKEAHGGTEEERRRREKKHAKVWIFGISKITRCQD